MKLLIILGLVGYVFYKVGGVFFRAGAASQQNQRQPRKPEGTINVETEQQKEKRNGTIKGGDYVDYEEVK